MSDLVAHDEEGILKGDDPMALQLLKVDLQSSCCGRFHYSIKIISRKNRIIVKVMGSRTTSESLQDINSFFSVSGSEALEEGKVEGCIGICNSTNSFLFSFSMD